MRKIMDAPTSTRVAAMIVIIMDCTVSGPKEPLIHSRVATPSKRAGMLPRPRKVAISRFTDCWRKCWKEPVSLLRVANVRFVPTAVGAGTPMRHE